MCSAHDTGTQYAGLTEAERAAAKLDPHMATCSEPALDGCIVCRGQLSAIQRIIRAVQPAIVADTRRQAYWTLSEHASGYRSTDVFRRRREHFAADPDNAVLARGVARDEWYARGIEAAARTVAALIDDQVDDVADPDAAAAAGDEPSCSLTAPTQVSMCLCTHRAGCQNATEPDDDTDDPASAEWAFAAAGERVERAWHVNCEHDPVGASRNPLAPMLCRGAPAASNPAGGADHG